MTKKLLLIFILCFSFSSSPVNADVLIEKDEDKYYYNHEICNVITNIEEIKKDYNFYYVNLSPMSTQDFQSVGDDDLKCLITYTGGNYGSDLFLVSKEYQNKIDQYNASVKLDNSQMESLFNFLKEISFINLGKSGLEISGERSVLKNTVISPPKDISEIRYYELEFSDDNSVTFVKNNEPIIVNSSENVRDRGQIKQAALIVATVSFIALIALLFIKKKNDQMND